MKNVKKKKGIIIQAAKVKPTRFIGIDPILGAIYEPNPLYEQGRRQVYIIHRKQPN